MGHWKNCKELRAVAYNHRNNVVMFCLMEQTLRFSPKKVLGVTGQPVVCSLGFWCLALVLSPCGQVGLGHPELKDQSGTLPSTGIDGARAGVQHREARGWGWFRGFVRRLKAAWAGASQHRPEHAEHRASQGLTHRSVCCLVQVIQIQS